MRYKILRHKHRWSITYRKATVEANAAAGMDFLLGYYNCMISLSAEGKVSRGTIRTVPSFSWQMIPLADRRASLLTDGKK